MPWPFGPRLRAAEVGDSIEQLMSVSRAEFLASLEHVGSVREIADGQWLYALDGAGLEQGQATITFAPAPSVRLGGLLELPRARVTIRFDGGSTQARASFLRRFEIAFQRGGG